MKINTPTRLANKIGKSSIDAKSGPMLAPVNKINEYNEIAEPLVCSPSLPIRDMMEGKSNEIDATKGIVSTAIIPGVPDNKRKTRLKVAKLNPISNV